MIRVYEGSGGREGVDSIDISINLARIRLMCVVGLWGEMESNIEDATGQCLDFLEAITMTTTTTLLCVSVCGVNLWQVCSNK